MAMTVVELLESDDIFSDRSGGGSSVGGYLALMALGRRLALSAPVIPGQRQTAPVGCVLAKTPPKSLGSGWKGSIVNNVDVYIVSQLFGTSRGLFYLIRDSFSDRQRGETSSNSIPRWPGIRVHHRIQN